MKKNISSWYPPSRYVFYPLYKFYRKKLGLNSYSANLATWSSSAVLHASIFLPQQRYSEALFVGGFFLSVGIASTTARYFIKKQSRTLEESLD